MMIRTMLSGAALALFICTSGCSSQPADAPVYDTPPATVQLDLPVAPPAQELTGTDAGLITTPAPTVQELEEQDRAAAPAPRASTPPAPVVTSAVPAAPTPAAEPDTAVMEEQLQEEQTGRQIDCPDGTVGTQRADGTVDCGEVAG